MGITKHTFDLIEKHGGVKSGISMLELGDQTIYFGREYGKYAKPMFQRLGVDHVSIDLGTQEGGALKYDLCKPIDLKRKFDFVTNAGTSEHCENLYMVFKNIHNLSKVNSIIVHENPKTQSWPFHGYHFMTEDFYKQLAPLCKYEILELGSHPAMGNIIDGWNVYCVLRKTEDNEFISEKEFNKLDFKNK